MQSESVSIESEPVWIVAVRAAMRARGFSINGLGKAIGVAQGLTSRWLLQKGHPNPDSIKKLHEVLGVPLDVLLDRSPSRPEQAAA